MKKFLSMVLILFFVLVPIGSVLACSSSPAPLAKKVQISWPIKFNLNSPGSVGIAKTSSSLPVIKINGVPLAQKYISSAPQSSKSTIKIKKSQKVKTPIYKVHPPRKSGSKPAPSGNSGNGSKTPAPPTNPGSDPKPVNPPNSSFTPLAMQSEMLGYINAERAKASLAPLVLDEELCQGAYLKSKDMAVNGYFSHNSPTYGSPFDMMKELGIGYRLAGENIAKNTSVKGAHEAFMNSSGHRANILNSGFKKLGLGFYQSGSYLYVTQWFTN